jgi:hypothetical protein
MTRHDLIMSIRELLDRHLDLYEIASRLKVDVELIRQVLEMLS